MHLDFISHVQLFSTLAATSLGLVLHQEQRFIFNANRTSFVEKPKLRRSTSSNENWLLPSMTPPTDLLTESILTRIQSHSSFSTMPVLGYIDGHAHHADGRRIERCSEPRLLTNPATLDSQLSIVALKAWPVSRTAARGWCCSLAVNEDPAQIQRRAQCEGGDGLQYEHRIVFLAAGNVVHVINEPGDARLFSYGGRAYAFFGKDLVTIPATAGSALKHVLLAERTPKRASGPVRMKTPQLPQKSKNWAPLLLAEPPDNNTLLFYYQYCPPRVLSCHVEIGVCETYHEEYSNAACEQVESKGATIHGGSPLIHVNDMLLGVVHSYTEEPHTEGVHQLRRYTQRFVKVKSKAPYNILAFSSPFRFPDYFSNDNDLIQFCSGLVLTPDAKELVLTYGQGDSAALMVRVPLSHVLRALSRPHGGLLRNAVAR